MTMLRTLRSVADALELHVHFPAGAAVEEVLDLPIQGWSADSREVVSGGVFVAIAGGERFAADVVAQGAIAAVAPNPVPGLPTLIAEDPQVALGRLAQLRRTQLNATVIAIAGSSGKTSTKDLLYAALESLGTVHASKKSFNNEIGVPITVLEAPESTSVILAECGERQFGDLAHLGALLKPDGLVITSLGNAHSEFLGGPAGVAQECADLLAATRGWVVAPREVLELVNAAVAENNATLSQGSAGPSDVIEQQILPEQIEVEIHPGVPQAQAALWVTSLELDEEGTARCSGDSRWGPFDGRTNLMGIHQGQNALLAAAAAAQLGVSISDAFAGMAATRPATGRVTLRRRSDGLRVIDDTYNANPDSVRAALELLEAIPATRRIAILGEMRELGEAAAEAHFAIGALACSLGIDQLIALGAYRGDLRAGFETCSPRDRSAVEITDMQHISDELQLSANDVVLVKASRAAHLETLVAELLGVSA